MVSKRALERRIENLENEINTYKDKIKGYEDEMSKYGSVTVETTTRDSYNTIMGSGFKMDLIELVNQRKKTARLDKRSSVYQLAATGNKIAKDLIGAYVSELTLYNPTHRGMEDSIATFLSLENYFTVDKVPDKRMKSGTRKEIEVVPEFTVEPNLLYKAIKETVENKIKKAVES